MPSTGRGALQIKELYLCQLLIAPSVRVHVSCSVVSNSSCDPMDCSPRGSSCRQEYGSGLPFPSPGDLPDPVIEPGFSPLQADSLLTEPPRKPQGDASK